MVTTTRTSNFTSSSTNHSHSSIPNNGLNNSNKSNNGSLPQFRSNAAASGGRISSKGEPELVSTADLSPCSSVPKIDSSSSQVFQKINSDDFVSSDCFSSHSVSATVKTSSSSSNKNYSSPGTMLMMEAGDTLTAQKESSESSSSSDSVVTTATTATNSNVAAAAPTSPPSPLVKKPVVPAWRKTPNGTTTTNTTSVDIEPVMGGVFSWPALSESTTNTARGSSKSSFSPSPSPSDSSLKPLLISQVCFIYNFA